MISAPTLPPWEAGPADDLAAFASAGIVKAGWHLLKLPAGKKEPPEAGWNLRPAPDVETVLGWIKDGHNVAAALGESKIVHVDIEAAGVFLFDGVEWGDALRWRSQSGGLAVIASRRWATARLGERALDGESYLSRTAAGELVGRKLKNEEKAAGGELLLEIRSARGKYVLLPGCRGPKGTYALLHGVPHELGQVDDYTALAVLREAVELSKGSGNGKLPRVDSLDEAKRMILESGSNRDDTLFQATAAAIVGPLTRGKCSRTELVEACVSAAEERARMPDALTDPPSYARNPRRAVEGIVARSRIAQAEELPRIDVVFPAPASGGKIQPSEPPATVNGDAPAAKSLRMPLRLIGGEGPEIVDFLERTLAEDAHGHDPVYQRGGALCHLTTPKRGGAIARDSKAVVISVASPVYLRDRVERLVDPFVVKKRGDTFVKVGVDLPLDYTRTLAERGSWPNIPPLEGVVYAPTLRADGSLLAAPGYDPSSGLLADFQGARFPEVPECPTKACAERALELVARPLRGFPFVSDAHKAVAIAAILTALVRRSLKIAPAFGFSAPVRASGKTLLAKIPSAIATGRDPAAMPTGRDDEELRKRLFSVLLAGDAALLMDNVDRPLESAELCAILTSPSYSDRVLGVSRTIEVSTATTVLLTGNHLSVRGDLASRVLLSKIDPRAEFPEQRTFDFDPVQEALRERGELAAAGLTIVRAYLAAGRPKVAAPASRFPAWASWCRDPLVWLGLPDPVETAHETELDDEERAAVAHVLMVLAEAFPVREGEPRSGLFVLDDAKKAGLEALLADLAGGSVAELTNYAIGRFLAPYVDRVVVWREEEGSPARSFVLRAGGRMKGRRRWRVEEVR